MPFNLGDLIHIGMQVGLEALNDPKKRAIAIAIASLIQKIITDPNAAADALSDALGGRPADRVFAAQMKELSSTIRTLNGLFEHVAEGLQTFDRENIWGDHGVYVEFAPRWQSIVQRFNINLSQSRAASGRMQGRCERFWKEILPMLKMKTSDISDQEKYDRLGLFLGISVTHDHMWEEALLQDQIASSNISQEFTNIQIAISGFRAEFQAYSRKAAENLNEQVRSLTRQMEKLQQSLVGLQISKEKAETISHTGSTLSGFGSFLTFTGVLAPVGIFCTILGAGASIGGSIEANGIQRDAEEIQHKLNDTRMALNEALHKQQRMHTVVKELVALLDGDMHTIQMKLGTLASSWEFIRVYAQEVRTGLKKALDSKAPFFLHNSAVRLSIESYKKLGACVKAYSDGFDDPERTVEVYLEAVLEASKF